MLPLEYDSFQGYSNPAGLAWLLFAQTGEPGYYLLYNDLTGDQIEKKHDTTLE